MTTTTGYDAVGANAATMPAGQHAGYVTGSGYVPWSAGQYTSDPGAVRICQDAGASVATADVLDVESGAATPQDCPGWVTRARATFARGTRPGQRRPMIYCSPSMLQPVISELRAAGIAGVPFWMARPGTSLLAAQGQVNSAAGSYPCGGVQFWWGTTYDANVWSAAWLADQSGTPMASTVQVGNSGPAVLGLQKLLIALGAALVPDGLFGSGTLAAVLGFQGTHGLTRDGIVGPATWAALGPAPAPAPPDPRVYPAPAGLTDRVLSVGSLITFSWGAVPGASAYTLQAEVYKPGFGWVLSVNEPVAGTSKAVSVSPRSSYRWRVAVAAAAHAWPAWVTFTTT